MRRGVGGGYCPARTANREPRTANREPSTANRAPSIEHREPPTACRKIREVGSLSTAHRPPPTAHAIAPPPSTSTVDPVA
ncbi:hypothetical protein DIS09_33700 [Burkholderia pseudomallei]|nr:hypothetical protein DPQ97_33995 [Burkholderia pseudomallei]RAP80571.1 hypothetical protein DPR01_34365 [Burkholderia pseudomallei]RAP85188.1 hypothetical protein DPQ99_33905 [Burkholderia pseudomallei]RAP99689.1 hypothetical protein DPQ98_33570 [Burkholderia pseudomallei]RAQ09488.1 hypothetical protein DPR00_33380 [Burkholderia pseudomallei]